MTRLATLLFLASGALFVAGVAGASSGLIAASIVVSVLMLAALFVHDRQEARPSLPSRPGQAGGASGSVAADGKVTIDAIALDGDVESATTTKATATAVLDDEPLSEVLGRVNGLGPRKVEAIVDAFGTSSSLRAASKDELLAVPGIGPAIADRILAELG